MAYLFACVRSAAMDLGRSDRRRELRERETFDRDGRPTDTTGAFELPSMERVERQALIEAALNQLPGDQREVVVMKIWGGLMFAQIAEALAVPLHTAASRYRYAIARLETELSEEVTRE